jgi:hypothetical protein
MTVFHKWATVVWAALVFPTVTSWRESIVWIAFMSLYANVVGHWGAYQAARLEKRGKNNAPVKGPITRYGWMAD